jgi:hypothetical protein
MMSNEPRRERRPEDQNKAGLQDDHDPRDPAQQQNDKPKGSQPDVQPDGNAQGGIASQGGM